MKKYLPEDNQGFALKNLKVIEKQYPISRSRRHGIIAPQCGNSVKNPWIIYFKYNFYTSNLVATKSLVKVKPFIFSKDPPFLYYLSIFP
ncbi:MAG: hypothetical protein IJD28_02095 [Deferribacterales bacterium]|nr:hypothetical protein [Deferribacterales bacterium]